jgi:hypothetical protein
MRQTAFIRHIFIFIVLVHVFSLNLLSQKYSLISRPDTDTPDTSAEIEKHALYGGTGYGSNMIYLGSTMSQDQPYGYASLSYGFKGEFFATVSSVHLSGIEPYRAFDIGSLSYSHVFNSWFDISAGIYGYKVAGSLKDTLFGDFLYGDITLGLDWKLIYSKFSAGTLLSDDNLAYFQLRNSRYFSTPEFFRKKVYISFDPYVNLLMGTLLKSELITETSLSVTPVYRRRGMTSGPDTTSTSYTYTDYSKVFRLMEVDIGLPVAINTNFMTLEAEASYIFPVHDDPSYPAPKGFVFLLSCYLKIF